MPTVAELQGVIDAIMIRSPQDSTRLGPLADYAIQQLTHYGLPGVHGGSQGELAVQGLARVKNWDVAYEFHKKPRLLVSMKSIWANVSGTVPNRLDDMMGEAANVQQLAPEVVIGYVMIFDVKNDTKRKEDNLMWSEFCHQGIKRVAVREPPLLNQGLVEGTWFILVNSTFPAGSRLVNPQSAVDEGDVFCKSLLRKLYQREPAIPFSKPVSEY